MQQDISASLNGVTQSYTKLAISCTSTACTDAGARGLLFSVFPALRLTPWHCHLLPDFKFAAETAATAAWNQAKTAGSASVT